VRTAFFTFGLAAWSKVNVRVPVPASAIVAAIVPSGLAVAAEPMFARTLRDEPL